MLLLIVLEFSVMVLYLSILFNLTGMELYLERLVRALAGKLQVPLLVLDGSVLAPHVRI